VPRFTIGGNVFCPVELTLDSAPLTDAELAETDAVVIVTGHHTVDYARILAQTGLVVDSCNVTRGLAGTATVIRLGAPLPALS
jgi:UDP-N-acetyl-D-mannosaminuronate dehydrogenase